MDKRKLLLYNRLITYCNVNIEREERYDMSRILGKGADKTFKDALKKLLEEDGKLPKRRANFKPAVRAALLKACDDLIVVREI